MFGSRRIAPTMSSKFRRIVVLPSITTSGGGTWNRSPLLKAAGNAFFARARSCSLPREDTNDVQCPGLFKVCGLNSPRRERGRGGSGTAAAVGTGDPVGTGKRRRTGGLSARGLAYSVPRMLRRRIAGAHHRGYRYTTGV